MRGMEETTYPEVKKECFSPDEIPACDCSIVKVESDESGSFEEEDSLHQVDGGQMCFWNSMSTTGKLEGLGASLAVIKMEMDLPDSSESCEITESGSSDNPQNSTTCVNRLSEDDPLTNCQAVLMDPSVEMGRGNGKGIIENVPVTSALEEMPLKNNDMIITVCLYNCTVCRFSSLSKNDLVKHMASHIEVRHFSCEHCLPLFLKEQSMRTSGRVPYSCGHCLFRTEDMEEIKNHSMVHHKALAFLSELDSVATSQNQPILNKSTEASTNHLFTNVSLIDNGGTLLNFNKENVSAIPITGVAIDGLNSCGNDGDNTIFNPGIMTRDIRAAMQPITSALAKTKRVPGSMMNRPGSNCLLSNIPPQVDKTDGSNRIISISADANDESDFGTIDQDKLNCNFKKARRSQRVLIPKTADYLQHPMIPSANFYHVPELTPVIPAQVTYSILPQSIESPLPVPIVSSVKSSPRFTVTSTTDAPKSGNKKRRIHHKKRCPYCGHEARDSYCLKVHMLTHSKEKPFACPHENCSYRATQKAHIMKHLQSVRHSGDNIDLKISFDSS